MIAGVVPLACMDNGTRPSPKSAPPSDVSSLDAILESSYQSILFSLEVSNFTYSRLTDHEHIEKIDMMRREMNVLKIEAQGLLVGRGLAVSALSEEYRKDILAIEIAGFTDFYELYAAKQIDALQRLHANMVAMKLSDGDDLRLFSRKWIEVVNQQLAGLHVGK